MGDVGVLALMLVCALEAGELLGRGQRRTVLDVRKYIADYILDKNDFLFQKTCSSKNKKNLLPLQIAEGCFPLKIKFMCLNCNVFI